MLVLMLLLLELLLLCLDLLLLLLRLQTQLSHILLCPFQSVTRETTLAHTGEDQRYHRWRNTAVQGVAQHALFDLPLIETKSLLLGPLFFLFPFVLLGLGLEPVAHRLILTRPLTGRSRQVTQRGVGRLCTIWRTQIQAYRSWQTSMRVVHAALSGVEKRGEMPW